MMGVQMPPPLRERFYRFRSDRGGSRTQPFSTLPNLFLSSIHIAPVLESPCNFLGAHRTCTCVFENWASADWRRAPEHEWPDGDDPPGWAKPPETVYYAVQYSMFQKK
jgi:hypothetical protein